MPRPPFRPALGFALLVLAAVGPVAAWTGPANGPDFSGIWRLDDTGSDTAEALEKALRREALHEQAPALPATGTPPAAGHPREGGMGRGGRASGGHEGMGGGMRGGMGGHRGGRHGEGKAPSDGGATTPTHYATPAWLDDDGVLIVQQDDHAVQLRLDSGTRLDLVPGGPARQMLNGTAMVRSEREPGGMQVEMRFADGSVLTQDWTLSGDGRQLALRQTWRLPVLQRAVSFVRVYHRLG